MPLFADINTALKEAMKARDPKKDALASIKSEIKKQVIDSRSDGAGNIDPADDVVLGVLQKLAKQRKESIDEYKKADRQDLVDKEQMELTVIESFLPQKMSQAEAEAIVKAAVAEVGATSAKDMGKVMKAALAKINGRFDGKEVQALVKAALP